MNDYTTDLETSKKFSEVGIEDESEFSWQQVGTDYKLIRTKYGADPEDSYPAYMLSELIDMMDGLEALYRHEGKWCVDLEASMDSVFTGDTPIEASCKAIIWQQGVKNVDEKRGRN